jgi:uncharacterized protein involved in outer membrane biogenesis
VLRLLGRVVLALVTIVVVLLVAASIAIFVGFPISLDPLRGEFESMAATALGREVTIEGKMEIVPTLWPTLEVEGLRIGQPPDWPERPESGVKGGGFARAERAFLRLGVVPLLRGKLHVLALTGEGFEVDMEQLPDGRVNWLMKLPDASEEDEQEEVADEELPEGVNEPLLLELQAIDGIAFRDVRLHYRRPGAPSWEYELSELTGTVALDAAFELRMRGTLQGEPYSLDFLGDPLEALFTRGAPWPVEIKTEFGGAKLALDGLVTSRWTEDPDEQAETKDEAMASLGPFEFHALDLTVDLEGERLDHFDPVLGLRLPRLGPYALEGTLVLKNGQYSIDDLGLRIGSSRLSGKMSWNNLGKRPRFDVALRAPNIQLADFPGWEKLLEDDEVEAEKDPEQEAAKRKRRLEILTSDAADHIDGTLRVDVDQVVAGRDKLGAMHFVLKLAPNRSRLAPFTLEVPGGSIGIRFDYVERAKEVSLDLDMEVDHFDYGVLARYLEPETGMRGLISLDVELKSQGTNAENLLHAAEGRVDLALAPAEFEAGVIDLWTVNLVASVLPILDTGEKSVVECLIAHLNVKDGHVTEHVLLVDTTRMRVSGTADINLAKETVRLEFEPVSKRPEFFSLATPIAVDGTFEDFDVAVRPEDMIGTIVRFVTSVVVVPVQRFIGMLTNLSDDAICQKALNRETLEKQKKPRLF